MGALKREFLDPETEADIVVREVPLEREDGSVSRRLKVWQFENRDGEVICAVEVHRTANLGQPTEIELEELYLQALHDLNPLQ